MQSFLPFIVRHWRRVGALLLLTGVAGAALSAASVVEIDKNSGRIRTYRTVIGLRWGIRIEESEFLRFASRFVLPEPTSAKEVAWRRVSADSLWRPHSPHYVYHCVPTTLNEFAIASELSYVHPKDVRKEILTILNCLKDEQLEQLEELVAAYVNRQIVRRTDAP